MGERLVGTISRGVRAPIIRKGDNLAQIVMDSVLATAVDNDEGFTVRDMDVLAAAEAVVAGTQDNYATVSGITADVKVKYGGSTIDVIFPILSKNHFSIYLKRITGDAKKIVLMLSYPSDEVGNRLVDEDELDEKEVNPWSDVPSEERYRELFGCKKHEFTGVDYVGVYKELVTEQGAEAEVVLINDYHTILDYTDSVLCCDVHSRARARRRLLAAGARAVYGLDDILTAPVDGNGYSENYGLLGSNEAIEDTIKLFPRDCEPFVNQVQQMMKERTGRQIEVTVYGDDTFKGPIGKVWRLADPCVSPAFTPGLNEQPNEVKLKYLANNNFADLSSEELKTAISERTRNEADSLMGNMASQGTTPRRLTDLIGSLRNLTPGSGDKGTPIIYIRGYFDNYTK